MFERLRLLLLRLVPSPLLRLVEGFWATPLAMAAAGLMLAAAVQLVPEAALGPAWVAYLGGIDVPGAQSALSVVAGGMVSLIAMVFSLTFVALSITAQQLSPRILDFVLHERSTQILLGLALASFAFSALGLSMGAVRGEWRLGLALPPALGLAGATLVMVVVFAHRMTRVMRAEEMVARIGTELVADIHRVLRGPAGCSVADDEPDSLADELEGGSPAPASAAGYVGLIDYAGLVDFAAANDLRMMLTVRESDFLLPGVDIARVAGLHEDAPDPAPAIERCLNMTDRREASDTAGYEAAALCEAALRALSPGINDPATAISCLNRLFAGLAILVASEVAPTVLAGEDGIARVLRPRREAPEFIANAVVPVLRAARGDPRVLDRVTALARQLDALATRTRDREAIAALISLAEAARDA